MQTISLIGLVEIVLPAYTVRLCDGGFIVFEGQTFMSKDPVFGTIGSIEAMSEGVGDEIPQMEMTLLPPVSSAPSDLTDPGFQNKAVRFWLGEFNQTTGVLIGTPDLMFDGHIDQVTMIAGRERREIQMSMVSAAERLFLRNDGNSMTPRWHKSIWPDELGHDNAVGLTTPVAWGVENRPVASSGAKATPYNGWGRQ